MARIPDSFIDELIDRVDIVELINQRVPLKRAGREFTACCPFHSEKSPSFTVSPNKQFYHCFGCGAHGTAVSFLMNFDNLDFRQSIDLLAGQAGMEVPEQAQIAPEQRQRSEQLVELISKVDKFFRLQLRQHTDAPEAISYLKHRGLSGEIAADFGIGFAPEAWDNVIKAFGHDSEALKMLMDLGLLIEKKGGGYYDRFRGRVMFPIEDSRGRVVGFGGRVLGDGEPKYLNSPETALFHKGNELYGLYRARREIGAQGYSLVVEGYMDVIGLAQFGYRHAVATLGTATTAQHLVQLFRAAPDVVFCFDGDRAGRQAAWRAVESVLPEMHDGRQVSILLLPDGHDPDSLVREEGLDAFTARCKDAKSLPEFFFDSLSRQVDLTRMDGQARLAELAKPLLASLPEGTLLSLMQQKLTQLIGVTAASSPESRPVAPSRDYNQTSNQAASQAAYGPSQYSNQQSRQGSPPRKQGEDALSTTALAISLVLQYPAATVELELPVYESDNPGLAVLVQLLSIADAHEGVTTAGLLERMRGHKLHSALEKLAMRNNLIEEQAAPEVLSDCLLKIHTELRKQAVDQLLALSRARTLSDDEVSTLKSLLQTQEKAGVK